MRLLELLSIDGPATATRLAGHLGESTGTVSWHLRLLAEHGFIEEDTGRGTKRERWWRRVAINNELATADFCADPDTRGAFLFYLTELTNQYFRRVLIYINEEWEDSWRNAGTVADWTDLRLTSEQLKALNAELMAVVARHTPNRNVEPAPDALPIVVQLQAFPRKSRGTA